MESNSISQKIDIIMMSEMLDAPLRIKALVALVYDRHPDSAHNTNLIMQAIESICDQMIAELSDNSKFESLWNEFDVKFSSVRSIAKSAMKIGYMNGKLDITK